MNLITKLMAFVFLIAFSLNVYAFVQVPGLTFGYSAEYNDDCEVLVQESWIAEAKAKQLFFAALWSRESPELFHFFFKRFNQDFPQDNYTAKLSVCPSTVSYSNPLVLNISRFLESYAGIGAVNPDYAFIVLTFHELMHNWVDGNLERSPLLEKYSSESRTVKGHLHLMAIEQYVYSGIGRDDLLGWIEKKYPSIGGDYARAWQIVNTEGSDAFLLEFEEN